MNEVTQEQYRKRAAGFYKKYLGDQQPTPKRLSDALKLAANDYTFASWRVLRSAVAFDQEERGFDKAVKRVKATVNPVSKDGDSATIKAHNKATKRRDLKKVDPKDHAKLLGHFRAKGDHESAAAITLVQTLGIRPAELKNLTVVGDQITVIGAKKRDDRGADRVLTITNEKDRRAILKAVHTLEHSDINSTKLADRINRAGTKLWPKRKAGNKPTLKSYRHQLGSDLKAAVKAGELSKIEAAYIMGHQSTESMEVYGDVRRGTGGRSVTPGKEADLTAVRDRAVEPPSSRELAADAGSSVEAAESVNSLQAQQGSTVDLNVNSDFFDQAMKDYEQQRSRSKHKNRGRDLER